MSLIRKIIKEPLLHFLLGGVFLFVLYDAVSSPIEKEKTIIVDQEALITFIQYRSKNFDPRLAQQRLKALSKKELQLLIDDYVREEALFRQAKYLGLEKEDYVIRQRVVQKLDFINQGFIEDNPLPKEEVLETFFQEHQQDYYVEAAITFTHVFFDKEKHGSEKAKALTSEQLKFLQKNQIAFSEAPKYGDRFYYHVNYVERTLPYVASHFGESLAQKLFSAEADSRWQGPYESPYGSHLVLITKKEKGYLPNLKEIHDRVVQDYLIFERKKLQETATQKIISQYEVQINLF